jgi:hypothetical protein
MTRGPLASRVAKSRDERLHESSHSDLLGQVHGTGSAKPVDHCHRIYLNRQSFSLLPTGQLEREPVEFMPEDEI